jgi:hypothetical protein
MILFVAPLPRGCEEERALVFAERERERERERQLFFLDVTRAGKDAFSLEPIAAN